MGILYVLMFFVAAAIIIGAVIAYQKKVNSRSEAQAAEKTVVVIDEAESKGYDESYWRDKRGLKPNTPPEKKPTPPVREPNYKFVGDARYRRYHRPNCRHVSYIAPDKRVLLVSASEAFAKGFVPCKVCNPPVPDEEPRTVERPTPDRKPQPKPKPPRRAEKPVALPVKDVDVPFKYWILSNKPDTYRGVIQVDMVVEVLRPLQKKDILKLAQKLVAGETRKQHINAVSLFLRTRVDRSSSIKWVCMIEWAPFGNLIRASEVKAGDYRTHKFSIYQQGFFDP